ncbi:hypothetical protein Z947_3187 [Sulfitobacter geojensis]|nr:hypothetical protein Z947_3187 [Sulfitobacter geojensis]
MARNPVTNHHSVQLRLSRGFVNPRPDTAVRFRRPMPKARAD